MLNEIVSNTRNRRLSKVVGEYIATPRNGMVAQHYRKLGFATFEGESNGYHERWVLDLAIFESFAVQMKIVH